MATFNGEGVQRRNIEIEALRGIAVLMVIYAHLGRVWLGNDLYALTRNYVQPGTGVDLFFCISGYIITKQLLAQMTMHTARDTFAKILAPFWLRRLFRLAPTAWLWIAISIAVSVLVDPKEVFRATVYDGLAALLQLENFYLYSCSFGMTPSACGQLNYYWSLSLEEQFYIVFPLALLFLPRKFLIVSMAIAIVVQLQANRSLLLWVIRCDALLLGALIAIFSKSLRFERASLFLRALPPFSRWFILAIFVSVMATADSPMFEFIPIRYGAIAISASCLIWLTNFESGFVVPNGGVRNILAQFGARSYALYLVHMPVWRATSALCNYIFNASPPSWLVGVTVALTIYAAADLNFRWVEQPLRRYGRSILRTPTTAERPDSVEHGRDKTASVTMSGT